MARIEKTVFLSYRRTNIPWALAIYQDLTNHGYDVFIDYEGIGSGAFEQVILENIRARAHFLVLLTPSALARCSSPDDWLRREIETAIDSERNVVPLMLEGFSFSTPAIATQLTGLLSALVEYNGLDTPASYFLEAMKRLRERHLNVALDTILHPPSVRARQVALKQSSAANAAPAVLQETLTAQQYFERGLNAIDLAEAIRFYTEAIQLDPEFSAAYHRRAKAREDLANLGGAFKDYSEALRINPASPRILSDRGSLRQAMGDLEGALEDYEDALNHDAGWYEALTGRAIARHAKGDLQGALVDYDFAIRINPEYCDAYYSRALALEREMPDRAAEDLRRYLALGGGVQFGDAEKVERKLRELELVCLRSMPVAGHINGQPVHAWHRTSHNESVR